MRATPFSHYIADQWQPPRRPERPVYSALDSRPMGAVESGFALAADAVAHAREVGGPALRAMDFQQRAAALKALATHLNEHRETLYPLSRETGATDRDALIDIDGGIGTVFTFASRGRRGLPQGHLAFDGDPEALARDGSFVAQHIYTPRPGLMVQINAYNFPVWGLLEKLAPAVLAGLPTIIKPATDAVWLAHRCVELIIAAGALPPGAVQLVCGDTGALLDHLGPHDTVAFTGSAATAERLRAHPGLLAAGARLQCETDSLNAAVLGPDAEPDSPEFGLLVGEIVCEMTAKAGQKCTAIRRALVPAAQIEAVQRALQAKLQAVVVGHPAHPETRMGALAGLRQREELLAAVEALCQDGCTLVSGDPARCEPLDADPANGAFVPPMLLRCDDPDASGAAHAVEPFGPVCTLMPYRDAEHAIALLARGGGSLVASAYTADPAFAARLTAGAGAWHGRLLFVDRDCAQSHTGHGSPLPTLVHGGPGRAGGGEELGGLRAVYHLMQRSAVQASPRLLAGITGRWVRGAPAQTDGPHPFRLDFDALPLGKAFHSTARTITLEDIEHFAHFTGDTFYAHMDEAAAAANPFFPGRVAHGYLLLSFAAGLFVDPAPGPVLANVGLDKLRFTQPVSPGDSVRVELTAMEKTRRAPGHGEVRWAATLINQRDESVAQYELLTMNACAGS